MARIPYITDSQAGESELIAAIKARRGGNLGALDRLLLHSEPVAQGWGSLMGRVRSDLSLPAKWGEFAMCAVAVLNGAEYEWVHHAPLYLDAGGREDQLTALRKLRPAPEQALADPAFDDNERAMLRLVVESTLSVSVSDKTFKAARAVVPDNRQIFEFIVVISSYNMVSRILVALEVQPDD
ncbi:MAG: carboxymuconolactone decarboxylase family protein [Burkholderiaceae bacterium]